MTTDTDIEIIRTSLLLFSIIGIFGNLNIIFATWQNKALQHKCGIMLAVLATCDTLCLLNEFQSFLRMTLKLGGTSLRNCFLANITYVFIEPVEVYMIFVLAVDRLIALNFVVLYRTVNKKKYLMALIFPGILIGFVFLTVSFLQIDDGEVEPCILPNAMPENVSYVWNQYNLWAAVATLVVYFYTYMVVYCCTFKRKNEKSMKLQKAILNTVIVGAAVFSISSVLSAGLIAVTSNMENPFLEPDTVATYAVIPGLISYSCNFYVYYWRSSDYRNAFVRQLCCGKVLSAQETVGMSVSNVSRKTTHTIMIPAVKLALISYGSVVSFLVVYGLPLFQWLITAVLISIKIILMLLSVYFSWISEVVMDTAPTDALAAIGTFLLSAYIFLDMIPYEIVFVWNSDSHQTAERPN